MEIEESGGECGGSNVTQLLSRMRDGDREAGDELYSTVYAELRGLARGIFSRNNHLRTLQPTALVHEAWVKLSSGLDPVESQRHFFALAGRAMRQVITDYARARRADKRGGDAERMTLDERLDSGQGEQALEVDLLDLDNALTELSQLNARHARVAELRILSGLSIVETAEELRVAPRTVSSDWAMAKAWLTRALTTP